MEIVRDLRGHFTLVTVLLVALFLFAAFPQEEPRGYSQLAQAAEAVPGEATNPCIALSKTSTVNGQPRQVGEYCVVAAAIGSDKLTCVPDDTMPPGICKVHYCDPSGCHDTSMNLPSDIQNIQKGISNGSITPDTSFNTSQIQTPTDIQGTDVNAYTETQAPASVTSPSTANLPAIDQAATTENTNSSLLLYSTDAPAPTVEQFSQSSSFSQDSAIYQNVSAPAENTTAVNPVNTENTNFAPGSVNVEAPATESTFSNPSTVSATQAETQPSFWQSASTQFNGYINNVESFFGIPVTPNPCPDGICVTVGIRG